MINSVWSQLDVLAEYHFAHRLFGTGTQCLILLWGTTEGEPDAQELLTDTKTFRVSPSVTPTTRP